MLSTSTEGCAFPEQRSKPLRHPHPEWLLNIVRVLSQNRLQLGHLIPGHHGSSRIPRCAHQVSDPALCLAATSAAAFRTIDAASTRRASNQRIHEIRLRLPPRDSILAAYVAGWSEADPEKIASATTEGYEFHDPLVGRFSKCELPHYFALLRAHFPAAGTQTCGELGFTLRGPMLVASDEGRLRYWREAPLLGLTGDSEITVTASGVITETVAYDLNVACATLSSSPQACGREAD